MPSPYTMQNETIIYGQIMSSEEGFVNATFPTKLRHESKWNKNIKLWLKIWWLSSKKRVLNNNILILYYDTYHTKMWGNQPPPIFNKQRKNDGNMEFKECDCRIMKKTSQSDATLILTQ